MKLKQNQTVAHVDKKILTSGTVKMIVKNTSVFILNVSVLFESLIQINMATFHIFSVLHKSHEKTKTGNEPMPPDTSETDRWSSSAPQSSNVQQLL